MAAHLQGDAVKAHYIAFKTTGPDRYKRGPWKIEGPGLKPALFFRDSADAKAVRRALEQAFEAGRGRTRETLEGIGERVDEEDTDPGVAHLGTIPER